MPDVVEVDEAELTAVTARGAGVLRNSGLVVAPAGPMYGVYADVSSAGACARIFEARNAPRTSPLPVVLHNPRQMPLIAADVPPEAERLMAAYWPGPLTIVFRMAESLRWEIGEAAGCVALRMPPEPVALMLVAKVGLLACAAAAKSGAAPPSTAEQSLAQLGDGVDLYLDDGPREGEPSTIVDVSRGRVEVLRVGAVPAHHVTQVAEGLVEPGRRPVDAVEEDAT